ncbi:hypothetical protein JCM8208_005732 [Rhodotorula glutinis]
MASQVLISSALANLHLSSTEDHENQSPLLRLPDELLEMILEMAYANARPEHPFDDWPEVDADNKLVHKPLCRRLWVIQQRVRCWCIDLSSYGQLVDLTRTLVDAADSQSEPSIALLVVHLAVRVSERSYDDSDYDHGWDTDDEGEAIVPAIAANLLSHLFDKLGKLKSLTVDLNSGPETATPLTRALLGVIVEDSSTPGKLRGLESLQLSSRGKALDENDTGADDFAEWMYAFSRFNSLQELYLSFLARHPSALLLDPSRPMPVLGQLSTLSICADTRRWDLPLETLAPNLKELSLSTFGGLSGPILKKAPPGLVILEFSFVESEAIDDLLPAFHLLQSVTFMSACYDPVRLHSTLSQLEHLEHLGFGPASGADDDFLRGLVRKLPRLRRLDVDHVDTDRGPALLRERDGRERDPR